MCCRVSTSREFEPMMTAVHLPSWRDGPAKWAILDFVERSSNVNTPAFIPQPERIAAFDNDGTLWVEQPMPVQAPFLLAKLVERVRTDPTLADTEPYRSIVDRDPVFLAGLARQDPATVEAFLHGVGKAWEGSSPEAYQAEVRAFVSSYRDDRFGKPCTELVYQPMLELFETLRSHAWRVYVCSGGGRDFMRVIAEDTWGILRENVIGSAPEWTYRGGALVRENEMRGEISLGPGKPSHLFARTGRLPRFAAGNGDVDIEMLDVADFGLVIVHDDPDREYAYTAGSDRLLGLVEDRGWTAASMRNDWKTVFIEGSTP
jgi:phosphoglycolate phosphatase-like HAD superfamily hydrolase